MSNTGWKRSLGTSKREQGIITPKRVKDRNRKRTHLLAHKQIGDLITISNL